jgi:hypothetical protein
MPCLPLARLRGASPLDTMRCVCGFAPDSPAAQLQARGWYPVSPAGMSRMERIRVSQVPGGSWCAYAVFFDPGWIEHPLPWRSADAAPVVSKTKAPAGSTLEAPSHGLSTGCLRFVRAIAGPDARLASGCWLGFTGWDWSPTESLRKVSKVYSLHLFLLSQALLGAMTVYIGVREFGEFGVREFGVGSSHFDDFRGGEP